MAERLSENSRQGFDVQKQTCIGLEAWLSRNLHWGCGHIYDETPAGIAVYVRNDPVNLVDPDGRQPEIPWDAINFFNGWDGPDPDYHPNHPTPAEFGGGPPAGKCFIQVNYRPTKDVPSQNHSYIWVQDRRGNQHIIEGEPVLLPQTVGLSGQQIYIPWLKAFTTPIPRGARESVGFGGGTT